MTCIAGIEFGGKVYIAGDIQGTGWNNKVLHTQPKIFVKAGVLFGFAGSYRFGQILEHQLADPVIPSDESQIYRWLISVLIPDIKKAMEDNGYEEGPSSLIGVRGQLWCLQSDWSVLRSVKGYDTIGSGSEYASGSLYTMQRELPATSSDDIMTRLRTAIAAAGTFSPSVGTECTVLFG